MMGIMTFTVIAALLGFCLSFPMNKLINTSYPMIKASKRVAQPVISLVNTLSFALCVFMNKDDVVSGFLSALVVSCLICIASIDAKTMLIPRLLIVILGVFCFLHLLYAAFKSSDALKFAVYKALGFVFCFVFFVSAYYISLLVMKKEGMGVGDIKLMAVSGLYLGLFESLFALVIASVSASIILCIWSLKKREHKAEGYPFAPFLCAGIIASVLFYDEIYSMYIIFLDTVFI